MKVFLNKSVEVDAHRPLRWQLTSRRNLTSSKGGVVNLRASGSFSPIGGSEVRDERMAMTRSTAALRLVQPAVEELDQALWIDADDDARSADQIERRRRFRAVRSSLVTADALAISVGLVLATVLGSETWTGLTGAIGVVVVAAAWLVAFGARRLYL